MKNVICFFYVLLFIGCQKADDVSSCIPVPEHFPDITYPDNNQPTEARLALGKQLFFDTQLSIDSTISCASCHFPEFAFSDTIPLSKGVNGAFGPRNAPSLLNAAYSPYFNKDGGVKKLDLFALVPIEDHKEMGISALRLTKRLASNTALQDQAQAAYGRPLDAFVMTRALGIFVRSLNSGDSRYDAYLQDSMALSAAEERGRVLFHSPRTNCSQCHEGIFFTNHQFENNGALEMYSDQGRKLVTAKETDRATFKVPSLRNVAITGPYMHNGSYATLEEIVDHYDQGGYDHPNKSPLIQPLHLDTQEKADLIAFLHTLTDQRYTTSRSEQ